MSKLRIALAFCGALWLAPSPAWAGSAALSWDANSESDLAGYYIHYGPSSRGGETNPSVFQYPNKVNVGNVTSHSINNLPDGTTYYFSLSAYDTSSNESLYSSEVSKTFPNPLPPTAPYGLTASAVSSSQINLSWTSDSNNESGFKIERCQGPGCTNFLEINPPVGANITTYSNSGLSATTTYRYRVRAYNGAGNSGYSNVAGATTPAGPDTSPPVRSNGLPTGTLLSGTTQVTISLDTSENATCKYSTTPGISYASMVNVFVGVGSLHHTSTITGFQDGTSYAFYVRCQDGIGNANNNDFLIAFSIEATPTPTPTPTPDASDLPSDPSIPSFDDAESSAALVESGAAASVPGYEFTSGCRTGQGFGLFLVLLAILPLLIQDRRSARR